MLDIPCQYRPSYRNHARTSSETAPAFDTTVYWDKGKLVARGSVDAHCHPEPSEAVGKIKKDSITNCTMPHSANPAFFCNYHLPHLYDPQRQCPPAVRNPFVGIALERRDDALSFGNRHNGNIHIDGVHKEAHVDIRVHLTRNLPGKETLEPPQAAGDSDRLIIKGYSFPVRKLTQEIFLPRILDYRLSWQPPDLVYNVNSPLNPSAVQQLDIVKTWKRLSFIQAAEILHWEETFKLVLAANLSARTTLSDQAQISSTEDSAKISYISVHLDPLKIVLDMIRSTDSGKTAFRWFARMGNIHRNLLRFLRNQDCFIDPLHYDPGSYRGLNIRDSSIKITGLPKFASSHVDRSAEVELLWNPAYISFDSFDYHVEEGQVFHLRPSFCSAFKDLFDDALAKGEIYLAYSADVDWFRYSHKIRSFSGIVPVRQSSRTKSYDPSSTYTLDIIIKAELVEYFGIPILEQTMRTQIRLTVAPKKEPMTVASRNGVCIGKKQVRCQANRSCSSNDPIKTSETCQTYVAKHTECHKAGNQHSLRRSRQISDHSLDITAQENLAIEEIDTTGGDMYLLAATRLPLDVDIHNTHGLASSLDHANASGSYDYRHGHPQYQANRGILTYATEKATECVDPLKPAPLVIPKSRLSTLKQMQFSESLTSSVQHSSAPRFDSQAADLEAKYSSWKFSKQPKPGRRADYFMDFAATPRRQPRCQLWSSHDWDDLALNKQAGHPPFPEEQSEHPRSSLHGPQGAQDVSAISQQPVMPVTPRARSDNDSSSQNSRKCNRRDSNQPLISSEDTCISPSGGMANGRDKAMEETSRRQAPVERSVPNSCVDSPEPEPPLIRRDDALALLLRMRQIHEDERMSLGTNAEAIWFSSENNSEISLFEPLGTGCSPHNTVLVVNDGSDADDEAEGTGNTRAALFD